MFGTFPNSTSETALWFLYCCLISSQRINTITHLCMARKICFMLIARAVELESWSQSQKEFQAESEVVKMY
jgi:hypothetical protein